MVCWLSSCGGRAGTGSPAADSIMDTLDTVSEAVVDTIPETPLASRSADEYFNDFIYSFTTNRRFQMSRVAFPLPVERYGKSQQIDSRQWKFNRMHTRDSVYTVFFDHESSLELENSRQVDEVRIEWFYMKASRVEEYHFSRRADSWKLRGLREYGLQDYHDCDFIRFYQRFATDEEFQMEHLADDIAFTLSDPEEDFEYLEGTIEPEQWPSFRPELPCDVFTNIDYGQSMKFRNRRVVALEGSSNGFLSLLFFRRSGGKWILYKFKS
ncbi:MAG: DUF4348 domain-containing protein [Bacteroidaceae bacterium]|nr:DUF4348 domain-containing protein [Bacteroidaceae bacterium]